ncbi:LLM class flavin-dependent oxidoreductase [Plantactinospora sp. GCM10030261]|uniref:LLM class flavin-dependent oxidoreductase n=1 Tax=Plantactinospora sp. GCM10030261 TaxID=3273420 RepID=UPI00361DAE90
MEGDQPDTSPGVNRAANRVMSGLGGGVPVSVVSAMIDPMTNLGVVFLPQLPPERLRGVARAADEAGLDELWLWEDCFYQSGLASAAAALAWTDRLRVGVGLLPVPLRNVALTAMEVATLHRMFPGRVLAGVGHGVQDWMAQVGARVESPMTLLREYLDALRALLRGERVTVTGRYVRLDDVALDWPPATVPAVLAGATGPRTLRLSGERADGTILTGGTPVDRVREARRLVDEGRSAGNRTDDHPMVVYLHAATGPDAADRIEAERRSWGYEATTDVTVAGDAATVAAAAQRWADAGADTVVFQPTPDDPDPEGFVRFIAREVRPLVR